MTARRGTKLTTVASYEDNTGPQGPQGNQGAQGVSGTAGPQGSQGTAAGTGSVGYVPFWQASTNLADSGMYWDSVNARFGVGTTVTPAKFNIQGAGATAATTSFTVKNSLGQIALDVNDLGNVGIFGSALANTSYKLRVYGAIWATSLEQLSVLAGSSGVGSIRYYEQGTLSMWLYGPHAAESVKGFFTLKSQDISYTTPTSTILHADADFLDHPTLIIRSRNTSAASLYFQNYHYSLGAIFATSQPVGGNTDMSFRPARTERVVISNTNPAALRVESTTQGFLPPRGTTVQMNAITTPTEGLVFYDLDVHKLHVYDGTIWQPCW